MIEIILCLVVGYFCGCISTGYFVGKFFHKDIREAMQERQMYLETLA